MTPQLALILCIAFILILFVMERRRKSSASAALWIPLIWLMIMASRPIAAWIYPEEGLSVAGFEEGSAIDRTVLSILMISGVFVLVRRKIGLDRICRGNGWILLWFAYCGVSILWSDFPGVAFKRWIRAVGSVVMVFVVLSEDDSVDAIKTLIRRCAYVLVPLSGLVIKYYRDVGVSYEFWEGREMLAGVTTDKNALGRLALICGIFFIWDTATLWRRKDLFRKEICINGILMFMVLWLLIKSGSATSLGSFLIGFLIFFGLGVGIVKSNARYLGSIILLASLVVVCLEVVFNLTESFILGLGRDMTLTTRTDIWTFLLSMGTDPWLGTGYDSFWLGERLERVWQVIGMISEAHNGFLEIYLELGIIGLCLFVGPLFSAYRKVRRSLMVDFDYGRVRFTLLAIFLLYNITEAAYKATALMFFVFLLIAMEISPLSNMEDGKGVSIGPHSPLREMN
jgi:exopolysaccharide production protein ExoQ